MTDMPKVGEPISIDSVGRAIERSIVDKPHEIEQRLVVAMRSIARRSVESPKVIAALAAAESIPPGIVITSEDAAASLVDAMRTILDGDKTLASDLRDILHIPQMMEQAARMELQKSRDALSAAKQRGNDARVAYQSMLRRRAAEAEAKAREDARKAAEAAAVQAAELGEDEPPEAEVAPVAVPRTVSAGAAKSGTTVRIEATEIVDDAACPKEWKVIVRAIAEGFFRAAEQAGQVKRAEPGESIVFMGVRFVSVERAANR